MLDVETVSGRDVRAARGDVVPTTTGRRSFGGVTAPAGLGVVPAYSRQC
jgi:hypothetical protein